MTSPLERFWYEQSLWSQETFGLDSVRGCIGPLKHLEKEAKEAYEEAAGIENGWTEDMDGVEYSREEIADCLFLTFDAARRAGMTYEDLADTCFRKLEKNRNRKWSKPVDGQPCEHIRE